MRDVRNLVQPNMVPTRGLAARAPPILRAPALVPSVVPTPPDGGPPVEVSDKSPAPPGQGREAGSPGISPLVEQGREVGSPVISPPVSQGREVGSPHISPIDVHASGDEDWERSPQRQRAWRPQNDQNNQSDGFPPVTPGPRFPLTPLVSPAAAAMTGRAGGADPQGGEHQSVGPHPQGGTSDETNYGQALRRDPAASAPGAPSVGAPQPGPPQGSQTGGPQPYGATSLPPARLAGMDDYTLAAPSNKIPRRSKRAAEDQSPSDPPPSKKKKRGKKASKTVQDTADKPKKKKRAAAVDEAELLRLMQLTATQHGWDMTPRGIPPQAGSDPPFGAPPPLLPAAPRQSCPAALGAPPGEESISYPPVPAARFPTHQAGRDAQFGAPPPLPQAAPRPRYPAALGAPPGEESTSYPPVSSALLMTHMGPPPAPPAPVPRPYRMPSDPVSSQDREVVYQAFPDPAGLAGEDSSSVSDEYSSYDTAPSEHDIVSVSSGAPPSLEPDITPGLRHLSEEAEALLLRYLSEFYAVQPAPGGRQPSRLFRADAGPPPGIPLTEDFRAEYERIASEPPPRGNMPTFDKAFAFQPGDTSKYLAPEKLAPEVLALGEHVAATNPLRRQQYVEEDKKWVRISALTRSSMRLSGYAVALSNLAAQADALHVTQDDRALLSSLLLTISELSWKQATRASLFATRRRRELALSALGFSSQQRAQLTRDMPCEGPFLFSGQFTARLREELQTRQQARELAGQLRQAQSPRGRRSFQARPPPRTPPAQQRVTVQLPAPQPRRGGRGGRGRYHRGRARGQHTRGQAAKGRGGF